jgi:drug/metabolite transporter (DMT)-like permease
VARMPVAVATSLLYLVPPVAVLIAWVWLGELPLVTELLGGVVVIVGVVIISQAPRLLARRAAKRTPSEFPVDVA